MSCAIICCIQVVPDLYAVAMTMSSGRGFTTDHASESKWCDSYVLVLVQPDISILNSRRVGNG